MERIQAKGGPFSSIKKKVSGFTGGLFLFASSTGQRGFSVTGESVVAGLTRAGEGFADHFVVFDIQQSAMKGTKRFPVR